MSEFKIAKVLRDMVAAPAGETIPDTMFRTEDGILHAFGTVVPVDGTADFAESCIFHKIGGSGSSLLYVNRGSDTSSLFIALGTQAFGTTAGRGASPAIWSNCPVDEYKSNHEAGSYFFDDFMDGFDLATNQNTAEASALGTTGKWTGATAATGGNTVASVATDVHGAIIMSGTTDDEDTIIAYPKTAHIAGKFKFTAGKKLWMECRLQTNVITDAISQLFIGFAEEGLVATTTLLQTSEGGVADKDYVAFTRKYAASHGEILDTVFNTESGGTTPIEVGADAVTLEAATYTKIGMYCDGTTLYFYQDGVVLADSVAIGATDFPIDEEMAFYISLMVGAAGADSTVTVDWVSIAQEY
jgi:hypothetical protein